jgi:DUF971 family protein
MVQGNNEGKQHVKKEKKKKQLSRILQVNEYIIYYTFEDGHVGRNM